MCVCVWGGGGLWVCMSVWSSLSSIASAESPVPHPLKTLGFSCNSFRVLLFLIGYKT